MNIVIDDQVRGLDRQSYVLVQYDKYVFMGEPGIGSLFSVKHVGKTFPVLMVLSEFYSLLDKFHIAHQDITPCYIGSYNENPDISFFSVDLHGAHSTLLQFSPRELDELLALGALISAKKLLLSSETSLFEVISRAIQKINWLKEHQYCGRCGDSTILLESEQVMACDSCGNRYYPRISPCVIGLVTKEERVLLVRSSQMTEGFYTNVAGFIEAGETAEHAFEREVKEETGILIHNIRYFGTQSWPFPGQLMIAFTAEYLAGNISVDEKEIEEALWFNIDELPSIPPKQTISGQLLESFKQHRQ